MVGVGQNLDAQALGGKILRNKELAGGSGQRIVEVAVCARIFPILHFSLLQ